MNKEDYLALRKALNLLHQLIEKDIDYILANAEDVLRNYENKQESDDQMISTVSWINAQIENLTDENLEIEIDDISHINEGE